MSVATSEECPPGPVVNSSAITGKFLRDQWRIPPLSTEGINSDNDCDIWVGPPNERTPEQSFEVSFARQGIYCMRPSSESTDRFSQGFHLVGFLPGKPVAAEMAVGCRLPVDGFFQIERGDYSRGIESENFPYSFGDAMIGSLPSGESIDHDRYGVGNADGIG